MADAWMPGVRRVRADTDGGQLQGGAPRVVWVTLGVTPGTVTVISAARQLNRENRPCHLVWDPLTGDLAQLLPAVRAGRMLGTPDYPEAAPHRAPGRAAGVNCEGRLCVQIAVLGSEREPFTNCPMVRLGDILGWLDSWQIPRRWPAGRPAADQGATCLRSRALWACGGHYGASQVPGCAITGPGGIDIDCLTGANTAVVAQRKRPALAPAWLSPRPAPDLIYLDLPGQALDLLNLDLHRHDGAAAVADGPNGKLARQMQEAWSYAEQTIADNRQAVADLAATRQQVRITLLQIAARRQASNHLRTLSQTTRMQAADMRNRARHPPRRSNGTEAAPDLRDE